MKLTSRDRQIVFNKYGGKCAYCGCQLPVKGWHADHVKPILRKMKTQPAHYIHEITGNKIELFDRDKVKEIGRDNLTRIPAKIVPDGCHHPENNHIGNYLPACASCNVNKHDCDIEEFRMLIAGFIDSLNRYSTQYKFAKRYGLLSETGQKVTFYFEQFKPGKCCLCKKKSNLLVEFNNELYCKQCEEIAERAELN